MTSSTFLEQTNFYSHSKFESDFDEPLNGYIRFISQNSASIKEVAEQVRNIMEISPANTEITRGVISEYNSSNKLSVMGVGHCYNLNEKTLLETHNFDERALGIVIGNKFNVCYELTLNTGLIFFGYLITKYQDKIMFFQVIDGFDLRNYNNFEQSYQLGEQAIIRFSSVARFSRIDYLSLT